MFDSGMQSGPVLATEEASRELEHVLWVEWHDVQEKMVSRLWKSEPGLIVSWFIPIAFNDVRFSIDYELIVANLMAAENDVFELYAKGMVEQIVDGY